MEGLVKRDCLKKKKKQKTKKSRSNIKEAPKRKKTPKVRTSEHDYFVTDTRNQSAIWPAGDSAKMHGTVLEGATIVHIVYL